MAAFNTEQIIDVQHWTDSLFSFAVTRSPGFRFISGQFTMIGLEIDGRPLLRAYSMASASHEDRLEFFSIKVQDGPLTSRLQNVCRGDTLLVSRKATGTLITDNLLPGTRLLLLSTGTGLAPFASIIKEPDLYQQYEKIILVHGCRQVAELAYGERLIGHVRSDEFFSEIIGNKLEYYPTVTREPFRNRGRITDLIETGRLFDDLSLPHLDIATDRVMICGSPAMLDDLRTFFKSHRFSEANHTEAGHFVVERAFVER